MIHFSAFGSGCADSHNSYEACTLSFVRPFVRICEAFTNPFLIILWALYDRLAVNVSINIFFLFVLLPFFVILNKLAEFLSTGLRSICLRTNSSCIRAASASPNGSPKAINSADSTERATYQDLYEFEVAMLVESVRNIILLS